MVAQHERDHTMGTRVRDLQGQRTMIIDARETTVFIDADDFCYEVDKAILLRALAKELALDLARQFAAEACATCKHSLLAAAA